MPPDNATPSNTGSPHSRRITAASQLTLDLSLPSSNVLTVSHGVYASPNSLGPPNTLANSDSHPSTSPNSQVVMSPKPDRRALMACVRCRRLKRRCVRPDKNVLRCAKCAENSLTCKFTSVAEDQDASLSSRSSPTASPSSLPMEHSDNNWQCTPTTTCPYFNAILSEGASTSHGNSQATTSPHVGYYPLMASHSPAAMSQPPLASPPHGCFDQIHGTSYQSSRSYYAPHHPLPYGGHAAVNPFVTLHELYDGSPAHAHTHSDNPSPTPTMPIPSGNATSNAQIVPSVYHTGYQNTSYNTRAHPQLFPPAFPYWHPTNSGQISS